MKYALAAIPLLMGACFLPAFPPPSTYAPMPPVSAIQESDVELHGTLALWPSVGGAWYAPIPSAPALALDAHAQLAVTSIMAGPGFWMRSRPEDHAGHHFGLRLGGAVGTGDLIGFLPFMMPAAGPNLHLQWAHGSKKNAGSFAMTMGGEFLMPIMPEIFTQERVDDDGDVYYLIPVPIWYLALDLRYDLPIDEDRILFVGGGIDFFYASSPLPEMTVGLRL